MKLLNEEVYIIAPPISDIIETLCVVGKILLVRNGQTCNRVGVEVVVYVQTINVVPPYYICCNSTDIVAILLLCGVKDIEPIVREHKVWTLDDYIVACQFVSYLCLGAERIYPGVEFHTTFVALCNHPL